MAMYHFPLNAFVTFEEAQASKQFPFGIHAVVIKHTHTHFSNIIRVYQTLRLSGVSV